MELPRDDLVALERALGLVAPRAPNTDYPARVRPLDRPDGTARLVRVGDTDGGATPVLYIPGWGGLPEGHRDVWSTIAAAAGAVWYLETREKRSFRPAGADWSPEACAGDIGAAAALIASETGVSPVVLAPSWGAALVVRGLALRLIDAVSAVALVDPMVRIPVPRWVLAGPARLAPAALLGAFRTAIARAIAGPMPPAQRARMEAFVAAAAPGRWKRVAIAARRVDTVRDAGASPVPLVVCTATRDPLHPREEFARIAERSGGRFIVMATDEARRERWIGAVGVAFARAAPGRVPPELAPFVVPPATASGD